MPSSTHSKLLSKLTTSLNSFTTSPSSTFRIIHSIPSAPLPSSPTKNLYILDSSFNPPTLAHLRLATYALLANPTTPKTRLLLLLSTQNADKAPKPASYPQRLLMMSLFASELLSSLPTPSSPNTAILEGIDIGLTSKPYFVDKSQAIEHSSSDDSSEYGYTQETKQIHLVGFDTLVRILDGKYYPPRGDLVGLQPFLERHHLRVSYRTGGGWGEKTEQDNYIKDIGEGKREGEGAKKEWISDGRIVLVEGRKEGEEVISSTRVREAVKNGDMEALRNLVTEKVADYILEEGLYLEE